MKKRSIFVMSFALVLLLVVGGTMAWFTAQSEEVTNTFAAGTVDIELENSFNLEYETVNPGDGFEGSIIVTNTGSKRAFVRLRLEPGFVEDLSTEGVVSYEIADGWVYHEDEDGEGYYYYTQELGPNESTDSIIGFIQFEGTEMGNEYQGSTFNLVVQADAIQVTNGAALDEWGVDPLNIPQ